MRLVLLLTASSAFALNNSVTIRDLGTGQTNRPFSISRVFACGEFPAGRYPQPHALGGSAIVPYQVDVMTTCADGSVRHAIISFTRSISAAGSVTIDFVQSENRTSAWSQPDRAADQAAMLAFNGGGWGGKIQTTATGVTFSASARTMLAGGHWRYWLNGPVVRQVIIEDRYTADGAPTGTFTYDFGYQCNSSTGGTCPPVLSGSSPTYAATVWKAAADAAHKSLHPIFVATFYTGWSGIKTEFILENAWFGKVQDQQFDLALFNGGSETTPVYTRANTVFSAFRRMREIFWDGTAPAGWVTSDGNGSQPGVRIDYNLPYLRYSKAVPSYDPSAPTAPDNPVINAEATDAEASYSGGSQTQWCGDGTANGGAQCGNFPTNTAVGGATGWQAIIQRPFVRYLHSFSAAAYKNLIDNAQGFGSMPIALRESTTGRMYVVGGSSDAFGRPISIDARPQFSTRGGNLTQAQPADRMDAGHGTLTDGSIACRASGAPANIACYSNYWASIANPSIKWQPWTLDAAHITPVFYLPYIITGDWYYLEGQQFLAAWFMGQGGTGNYSGVTPASAGTVDPCYLGHRAATADPATGVPDADFGFAFSCDQIRVQAWALASLSHAWAISPASSPERALLEEKIHRHAGILEGALNIRDGNYYSAPSPASGSDPCNASTYTLFKSTPWCMGRYTLFGNKTNRLGLLSWQGSSVNEGLDITKMNRADSPWWYAYYLSSMIRAEDMGFSAFRPARQAAARAVVAQVMDSSVVGPDGKWIGPVPYGDYRRIVQNPAGNSIPTWLEVFQGITRTATLAANVGASDGTFTINMWASNPNCGSPASTTNMYIDGGQYLLLDRGTAREEIVLTGCSAICSAVSTVNISPNGSCPGQRGALGTTAKAHPAGAAVERLFLWAPSSFYSSKESGQYNQAVGAAAAGYDVSVTDSVTGRIHTGLRAFEVLRGSQRLLDWNTGNGACAGNGGVNCHNQMWNLAPPHRIAAQVNVLSQTAAQIVFAAPSTDACKIAVSASPFTSSDDSGDTTVAAGPTSRAYSWSGGSAGTTYSYRITCGPGGGTARTFGTFQTKN